MPPTELTEAVTRWAATQLPGSWTRQPPEVLVDNDELLVIIVLGSPDGTPADHSVGDAAPAGGEDGPASDAEAARRGLIAGFRAATRVERMALAADAEARFGRKLSWGARVGPTTEMFTTATVPVMTRLRFSERAILDTLIDAGLARSRSEALAWCVRLVGANEEAWIADLRRAFEAVAEVRDRGPRSRRPPG